MDGIKQVKMASGNVQIPAENKASTIAVISCPKTSIVIEDEVENHAEHSGVCNISPIGSLLDTPAEEALIIPVDTPDTQTRKRPMRTNPNTYAAKKTVAQGMMDIALITANANQLRYLIEYNSESKTFVLNVVLIVFSLMLQVAVGISLIFKGRFDLRGESKMAHARKINNYVVVCVFLVTIINVFVASFTINTTVQSN